MLVKQIKELENAYKNLKKEHATYQDDLEMISTDTILLIMIFRTVLPTNTNLMKLETSKNFMNHLMDFVSIVLIIEKNFLKLN